MARRLTNAARSESLQLLTDADGANYLLFPNGRKLYFLEAAITANTTLDDAETEAPAAGDFAITSHATGIGSIFRSDGTKWQFLTNA